MITLFCSLTVLLSITSFAHGIKVTQKPEFLFDQPENSAELVCETDDTTFFNIFWYRQGKKEGLALIAHSPGANQEPSYEENFKDGYEVKRPKNTNSSLTVKSLSSDHSAVYYCATSDGSGGYQAFFGEGTKLTVLEKDPVPPKLHILEPSKEEIVQKKRVTLVCLATNFYPDHINITWKINGKNRVDGVKTDDYAIKDNNTNNYSISSRLRLTLREWFNPENTFTCAVKFYKGNGSETVTPEKHISGKDGCGMTKALNRNESVAARISYVLLVGKSFLYGLFVTFLVWKLRPNSSSKRLN